jgi:hypothetical protein
VPENVIAFTVSGLRQKYLRRSLASWGRARGVQGWHLLFCVEPAPRVFPVAEFAQWAHRCFASAEVAVNDRRLGCLANTRNALARAFGSGAGFAVIAEEDCEVADDVLEYFCWARDAYAGDRTVVTACAHALRAERGEAHQAVRARWFNPVIWGTWPDRWRDVIAPGWGTIEGWPEAWDTNLRRICARRGLDSIFPVRSRALHIGETSTLTPGQLAEYYYRQALSSSFSPAYPPGKYEEVPFTEDLGLLV